MIGNGESESYQLLVKEWLSIYNPAGVVGL